MPSEKGTARDAYGANANVDLIRQAGHGVVRVGNDVVQLVGVTGGTTNISGVAPVFYACVGVSAGKDAIQVGVSSSFMLLSLISLERVLAFDAFDI
jgi:hypothetical protein